MWSNSPVSEAASEELKERIKIAVTAVLGALVAVTVAAWVLGFWPHDLVAETLLQWFGRVSGRMMFTGIFAVYGGILLAVLIPAAIIRVTIERLSAR